MAEDAVTVAPENYSTVFENDRVRILEVQIAPGMKTEVHSHPAHVAVVLEASKLRFSESGGEATERFIPAGVPLYLPATDHTTENIGDTRLHAYLIELKGSDTAT
jgi:quercetin dioxygenase-like cupin family protein